MDNKIKILINYLLKQIPTGVMLESKGGKLYLLHDHHKHLNPEKDSIRMLVGTGKLDKQFKYFANEI